MEHVANTAQAEVWNGEDGKHWAEHSERYDTMAEGANPLLFETAALTASSRVLDLGCGTGHTTRLAARQAAHATGIDLSAPMLDRARGLAAAEGLGNVTFVHGDAQVYPFPPGRFDVAISRAGVMFFADPVAAFGNIAAALAPGGRLVLLTHRDVSKRFAALYEALAEHVAMPADDLAGVTSFADPGYVRDVLTDAGFGGVVATPVEFESVLGRTARDATDFLLAGSLRSLVRDADEAALHAAGAAVLRTLRAAEEGGEVRMPALSWLYTATLRD